MKKFLSILLIIMLAVSLGACDTEETIGDENESENGSIGELKPENGAKLVTWESEGPELEFLKYAAQEFEQEYGVEVTVEPVSHTDALKKLTTDGPAGVGADVFAAPHDKLGEYVATGLIRENDITSERVNKDFMKAAATGVTFDGKVYGYPVGIETYALFYNKDLVEEVPETYEEIIEFAKGYNNTSKNEYALMWDVGNAYFSHCFIAGNGGYIFGKGGTDKDDLGLNTDAAVKGAEFMVSLKEILPLNSADTTYQIMDGLFTEGKAAMIINGPWAVQNYKDAGLNFGVAVLPKLPGGKHSASFSGIRTMHVSAYTQYPKASKLFAQFLISDEMLLKRFEMTSQIPPVIKLMEEDIIKNDPIVSAFLEQAQYAVPMPSIPQMGVVWEPYGASLSAMWNGDLSVKEALDNAVQTIEEAIESQGQ